MRYLIFSFVALFMNACADPDNPVVYTAPAGKVLQNQPPGTNSRGPRHVPPRASANPSGQITNTAGNDIGKRFFSLDHRQNFKTGGSSGDIWYLTKVELDIYAPTPGSPSYNVEIWTTTDGSFTPGEYLDEKIGTLTKPSSLSDGLNTFTGNIELAGNTWYALVLDSLADNLNYGWRQTGSSASEAGWIIHRRADKGWNSNIWGGLTVGSKYRMAIYGYSTLHTQSEIDRGHGRQISYLGRNVLDASRLNEQRHERLVNAGALPTVSVSSCRVGTDRARFTFSRTGPTDEGLTFSMEVSGASISGGTQTVTTGFSAGSSSFTDGWSLLFPNGNMGAVHVKIYPGWHNDMTGDFKLGTSTASVSSSSSECD